VIVDAIKSKILKVDCALQGVWLETGEHRVEFVYSPKGYIIGRWVSLCSALSLICVIFVYQIVNKSRQRIPAHWNHSRKTDD